MRNSLPGSEHEPDDQIGGRPEQKEDQERTDQAEGEVPRAPRRHRRLQREAECHEVAVDIGAEHQRQRETG